MANLQIEKYQLCVAALSGNAYISKVSKDNTGMVGPRKELSHNECLKFIHEYAGNWIKSESDDGKTMTITCQGKPVMLISLLTEEESQENG